MDNYKMTFLDVMQIKDKYAIQTKYTVEMMKRITNGILQLPKNTEIALKLTQKFVNVSAIALNNHERMEKLLQFGSYNNLRIALEENLEHLRYLDDIYNEMKCNNAFGLKSTVEFLKFGVQTVLVDMQEFAQSMDSMKTISELKIIEISSLAPTMEESGKLLEIIADIRETEQVLRIHSNPQILLNAHNMMLEHTIALCNLCHSMQIDRFKLFL